MSDCNAVQFSDQMTCSCGNVWDMNDPYPPECKTEPAMLAAAPAVKGEPVGYVSPRLLDALRSGKACGITMEDKPDAHNGATIPLYTAPHPAEQQPATDLEDLLSSKKDFYDDTIDDIAFALAFECEEAELDPGDKVTINREKLKAIAARVLENAEAKIAQQQPAPDVPGLVEALDLARRTLAMAGLEGEVTRRIDSTLAAHRKGGVE